MFQGTIWGLYERILVPHLAPIYQMLIWVPLVCTLSLWLVWSSQWRKLYLHFIGIIQTKSVYICSYNPEVVDRLWLCSGERNQPFKWAKIWTLPIVMNQLLETEVSCKHPVVIYGSPSCPWFAKGKKIRLPFNYGRNALPPNCDFSCCF